MGLSITFTQKERILCPKCGAMAGHRDIREIDSGGRVWYDLLEKFGYYPDPENIWYGKDMVLTKEQTQEAYRFVLQKDPYRFDEITGMIAKALVEGHDIVINADW